MSIEKINQAKAEIYQSSAYKLITEFFDADTFVEIDALVKSSDSLAEVVAGFGTVEGMPVYAFAQNSDFCGGALSNAQTAKLKKLYNLAHMTGAPVFGFYDSIGGRLAQGTDLLAGCGEVLKSSAALSGVLPQVSVILGTCLGINALNAVNADIVIMSEKAQLSLSVIGEDSSADYNEENGISALTVKDTQEAVSIARKLALYLPSNNLCMPVQFFEEEPNQNSSCMVNKIADSNTAIELFTAYGNNATVNLVRIDGEVAGVVSTEGGNLDLKSTEKIARFVRFCDAFSIPIITFVDCNGFESIKSACKVISAYAEATTVKISVIKGNAIGSAYIALAGTGGNADIVYAFQKSIISPINAEAATFIMAPERMKVPVSEQRAVADNFAQENLSAFNAAQNGYIDGIIEESALRQTLISALDMLSGKRVLTIAKKHSTI